MHYFSVAAMFKNEAHIFKEWIEHYLVRGADHFYLYNDESTDNSVDILQEYIQKGKITLFEGKWPRYTGRQEDIYTHYFLPKLAETTWLLVLDVDEFMWSPQHINLPILLKSCEELAEIQVVQYLFGSNGHIKQPANIVNAFTKRRNCNFGTARTFGYKYFVHSKYKFSQLNVHFARPEEELNPKERWIIINNEYFVLNHYSSQSKEYFISNKCTRGDATEFKILTESDFPEFDINEIEDLRLSEQNKTIHIYSKES
jgi:hypothetical protein